MLCQTGGTAPRDYHEGDCSLVVFSHLNSYGSMWTPELLVFLSAKHLVFPDPIPITTAKTLGGSLAARL